MKLAIVTELNLLQPSFSPKQGHAGNALVLGGAPCSFVDATRFGSVFLTPHFPSELLDKDCFPPNLQLPFCKCQRPTQVKTGLATINLLQMDC